MSKRAYAAVLVLAACFAACTTSPTGSFETERSATPTASFDTVADSTGRADNMFGSGN